MAKTTVLIIVLVLGLLPVLPAYHCNLKEKRHPEESLLNRPLSRFQSAALRNRTFKLSIYQIESTQISAIPNNWGPGMIKFQFCPILEIPISF